MSVPLYGGGMATPGARPSVPAIRRLQILAISVVGALAVLMFLASLLVGGPTGETLSAVAGGLGIACAVIGVSFAVVGNPR